MLTVAGNGDTRGGVWPPHPTALNRRMIASPDHKPPERNLPMHSSFIAIGPDPDHNLRDGRCMKWKTCSVEAGVGIGKLRRFAGVTLSVVEGAKRAAEILSVAKDQLRLMPPFPQRFYPVLPAYKPNRVAIRRCQLSGMQKHGLTMFPDACYSSLVPRVPSKLAVRCGYCVCANARRLTVELLRSLFPDRNRSGDFPR